jgi:hypothetical protein
MVCAQWRQSGLKTGEVLGSRPSPLLRKRPEATPSTTPTPLHFQIWGVTTSNPLGLTPMFVLVFLLVMAAPCYGRLKLEFVKGKPPVPSLPVPFSPAPIRRSFSPFHFLTLPPPCFPLPFPFKGPGVLLRENCRCT